MQWVAREQPDRWQSVDEFSSPYPFICCFLFPTHQTTAEKAKQQKQFIENLKKVMMLLHPVVYMVK